MKNSIEQLTERISGSFIASAEHNCFNGIVASQLLQIESDPLQLKEALGEIISDGGPKSWAHSRMANPASTSQQPDCDTWREPNGACADT